MKTRRLFNYPGTKRFLADKVNSICLKLKQPTLSWVEPFCGSASLFYNLNFKLADSTLNDLDSNIISMHQACKDFTYQEYLSAVKFINEKFGDTKASKEAYYTFRKWYNEEGSKTAMKGLYLIYLSSMCINSMLRFGPNGMNQGWGNRKYLVEEQEWNEMHERLQDTQLTSKDYRDISIKENSVIFLDPPYEAKDNDLYGHGFSQREFLNWLIEQKETHRKCLWLYTDVETPLADTLLSKGFKKVNLRDMVTICPTKSKDKISAVEVMYIAIS